MDLGIDDGRRPTIADVPGPDRGRLGRGRAWATRSCATSSGRACCCTSWTARRGIPAGTTTSSATSSRPTTRRCSPSRCSTVFNKMDLPEAREAWPAFEAAMRAAGAAGARDLGRHAARAWTSCATAVGDLLPDVEGLAEPPDPAGVVVHRLEAAGDGFTHRARGRRLPSCAASGSSGSPTRRTSTTRSRPSGSSASSPGRASTRRCARPASAPATRSGSGRSSWSGSRPRTTR